MSQAYLLMVKLYCKWQDIFICGADMTEYFQ